MDDGKNRDELLRAAASAVRAEIEARDLERLDRRWDEYCAGTLEAPERFLAAAGTAPETRLTAQLFAPLGAGFEARVVRELARRLASERQLGGERGNETAAAAAAQPAEQPDGARPADARPTDARPADARPADARPADARPADALPTDARPADARPKGGAGWLRRWLDLLTGGGGLSSYRLAAVAAGLVAVVGLYQLTRPAPGPLPAYELRILGAETTRSATADAETPLLVPGLRFDVRLRPARETARRPDLRVYVRGPDGELARWRAAERAALVHPDGAITIRDPAWELAPGVWTVYFAVGAPPPDPELRARLGRDPPAATEGWRLLVEDLRVGEAAAR